MVGLYFYLVGLYFRTPLILPTTRPYGVCVDGISMRYIDLQFISSTHTHEGCAKLQYYRELSSWGVVLEPIWLPLLLIFIRIHEIQILVFIFPVSDTLAISIKRACTRF